MSYITQEEFDNFSKEEQEIYGLHMDTAAYVVTEVWAGGSRYVGTYYESRVIEYAKKAGVDSYDYMMTCINDCIGEQDDYQNPEVTYTVTRVLLAL
ncbi:hypothetical protein N9937_00940 [bacterium]|nr:hypothetical protein [bacterium]